MKTVDILIVVDAAGTLASGAPDGNACLIDTNGFLGSWGEGTSALYTVVQDGTLIQWAVVPVRVVDDVSIAGFSGVMVDRKICLPLPETADGAP
ncbi:hypothetical protein WP05_22875 [Salmonella enterica subsp. arizonae]|nr:hypothetical protein [Salmonella enterica subsp. arizonae]